jgi:beta-fructofuranosidase
MYVFNNGTGAVKVSKLEAWELAMAAVNGGSLPPVVVKASDPKEAL